MLGRVYTPYFNDIQTILAAYIQVYDGFSYQTGVIDSPQTEQIAGKSILLHQLVQ